MLYTKRLKAGHLFNKAEQYIVEKKLKLRGFNALNKLFFFDQTAKQSFHRGIKKVLNYTSVCFSPSVPLMHFLREEFLCSGCQGEKLLGKEQSDC